MNTFYNHFFKEEFLNTIKTESSRTYYVSLFNKSKQLEEQLNKDMFNFTDIEVELLLYSINTSQKNTLVSYLNQCKNYCDYAIETGNKVSNINIYKSFSTDRLDQYLMRHKQKYLSKDDIMNSLKDVYNSIDFAVYMSIFEGLLGFEYTEITNLTKQDIAEARENKVEDENLNEKGYLLKLNGLSKRTKELNPRTIVASEELMRALEAASRQDVYYQNNGDSKSNLPSRPLLDGEYVFRNSDLGNESKVQTDKQFVYRKLILLKEISDSLISSVTTIINSGVIYHLSLKAKDGVINFEDVKQVANRYNITLIPASPNTSYKNFIKKHRDALKKVYGVDYVEIP
ncbi:hypothetical protein JTZ62_04635 [Mammaliicoccus sciuri]|uniref:phage lytic cycle repressor MrpR family protein n=1 Tax=Mammaliicoccus sciuri TaxID=1296 RepID=UPI0019D3DA60|nr:hypothetical protein [Mammaliicoccus sciuri]QSN68445.1 hypothetical protein JTZ62_04635 [Mammaliicoccus sciuri]UIU23186.1 hypothetical protein LLZ87_04645 [Mammaliicoccus sciuri]UIU26091.1 hypothetical protein LLZ92_04645 [Mammaliicoccus sciuri]